MMIPRREFLVLTAAASRLHAKPAAVRQDFGKTPDGIPVSIFTLTSQGGLEARVMTYGAILVSLRVPDRAGKISDVVLGFDTLDSYLARNPFFGAIVGRYANRIGKARFTINGTEFRLPVNSGGANTLHGGLKGFDKRVWKAVAATGNSLQLEYESADGEEGFPGRLVTRVTYTVTPANELRIGYHATVHGRDTVLNLTSHSYFNLSGEGSGTILGHRVQILADRFTPTTPSQIPTGELLSVAGTPFDFRTPQLVGSRIEADDRNLRYGKGYDHNFVISTPAHGEPRLCARVEDPKSGRVMEVLTTEPGVQFYTANNLDGIAGKGGKPYSGRTALCLETQHFPDSPNQPAFPTTVLHEGRTYVSTTIYRFSVLA